jgi:uncharacterized sporulation protein YeaH/YhbH (DUF444 family)
MSILFEAEISMEELQAMLFVELELPNLLEKEKEQMQVSDIIIQDVLKKETPHRESRNSSNRTRLLEV